VVVEQVYHGLHAATSWAAEAARRNLWARQERGWGWRAAVGGGGERAGEEGVVGGQLQANAVRWAPTCTTRAHTAPHWHTRHHMVSSRSIKGCMGHPKGPLKQQQLRCSSRREAGGVCA
jgi:hypothetical protein